MIPVLTKTEIQGLRALREKKHREARGLFVIEGDKVVVELLAAGFPFTALYATTAWVGAAADAANPGPAVTRVSEDEMARISHFPTPSSVLAVGRIEHRPLAPGALAAGLTLALDGVQDPGNVGTLLRIADWFAFDRVVLSPDCADLFHQKVINASMGSFARLSIHVADLAAVLSALHIAAPNLPILGADLAGDDIHALPAMRDAVVVIGAEGRGLSPAVRSAVARCVTIPRYGAAESLNAAVAAGIICAQLRRPR